MGVDDGFERPSSSEVPDDCEVRDGGGVYFNGGGGGRVVEGGGGGGSEPFEVAGVFGAVAGGGV